MQSKNTPSSAPDSNIIDGTGEFKRTYKALAHSHKQSTESLQTRLLKFLKAHERIGAQLRLNIFVENGELVHTIKRIASDVLVKNTETAHIVLVDERPCKVINFYSESNQPKHLIIVSDDWQARPLYLQRHLGC
ncbi:MAG: hypothetical protein CMF61_00015 [Magnetococcales bacterium]|nr:hypothetical protein [Magnetococcales bacterium]|tara:strand:+ start:389 stop:790 length:402 start_codon:yes stop_codon:yes gene_type:complete